MYTQDEKEKENEEEDKRDGGRKSAPCSSYLLFWTNYREVINTINQILLPNIYATSSISQNFFFIVVILL